MMGGGIGERLVEGKAQKSRELEGLSESMR